MIQIFSPTNIAALGDLTFRRVYRNMYTGL